MYSADPTAKGQQSAVSAAGGSRPALSFSPPKTYLWIGGIHLFLYRQFPGRRYLLCQPSLTGSSMTTEIKTGSMTWENPASPAYLFCYIRLPAAALPPNPTPMAAMAFPSPRQAPIQSAKPRSRPTPAAYCGCSTGRLCSLQQPPHMDHHGHCRPNRTQRGPCRAKFRA